MNNTVHYAWNRHVVQQSCVERQIENGSGNKLAIYVHTHLATYVVRGTELTLEIVARGENADNCRTCTHS